MKADIWITRFVSAGVGRRVNAKTAERLVKTAAVHFETSSTALDHAIWPHAQRRAKRSA